MSRANLTRRVSDLEDATVLLFCRDAWHNSTAARLAVVHEDAASGETPAPPCCPSCNAPPDLTIIVSYERISPALDGGIELRRTTLTWRED